MNKTRLFSSQKLVLQNLLPAVLAILLTCVGLTTTGSAGQVADVTVDSKGIQVIAAARGVSFMILRVADPQGEVISEQSTNGSPIKWSPPEGAQDGMYTYEVRVGFGKRNRTRDEAQKPAQDIRPWRQSGTVYVTSGAILPPSETETGLLEDIFSVASPTFAEFMDFLVPPAYADVVHADDVIIQGSLGVGSDSVNGQNFGFDTIILKENNLNFFFDDTSSTSSFPRNDWRIIINDSTDGGASYFAVEDTTAGRVPFKIEAGAPANSLYIEDYGRVGIGTALPYVELHIADGDTPTVRLDQDGSYGWVAQSWDVAGNESNFFVRDVTNGSKMPFRIQPNTPDNTLCLRNIEGVGRVGIGTWSPQEKLHVEGNAFVLGNLEVGSSREYKENIQTLQAKEAIDALRELRPVRFNYKIDPNEESIGFIAEEVPNLVATNSRKSLSTMDIVAVLAKVTQEQQKVIEQLSHKIVDLEKELKAVSRGNSSGDAL
jgi:hypothetical protein